ncbi:MAG: hypothetical protein HWQ38_09700 [Nostoc sp. NMS7]|uniref:hypothetical protein n=1 Tax=Nostoc sp. NMS7 TaxID=2815391 RepID=UPI0025D3C522|nr:hypothetical protein [Nostoc sp. NMS7]MBN3946743.1 hypothetical protein [Nostoc sp. NMS7]
MLNIASSFLTESPGDYRAHLAEITKLENNFATLATIDFGEVEALVIESASEEITLPANWESVTAIACNGQIFTPTSTPESPQPGEFLYNPYTNTVQVVGASGQSYQVYGSINQVNFAPPLLPPPYPQLFTNLPLKGTIQINCQFEQQPSGQFEFEVVLPKGIIQNILAPGTEIDIYNVPLRINSLRITELPRSIYPDGRCIVTASLGGRWDNYLSEPCFLRADGKNNLPSNVPFQDPDCVTGSTTSSSNPNISTTIQQLLAKIGIYYTGPNLAVVPIPSGTLVDAVVNPVQLMSDRLRVANSFVRWSNAAAVQVVPINSMRIWNYQESDILEQTETTYEAIGKTSKRRLTSIANHNPPSPDLVNFPSTVQSPPIPQLTGETATALAFEYPNTELTLNLPETQSPNSSGQESTQGQTPRYVRLPSKREERIVGDKNADSHLEGVDSVQQMSLIFDIGGQTKTRSTTTTEDGAKIKVVDEIWGFAATAIDMYSSAIYDPDISDSIKGVRGNPSEVWKCIKKTTTDYTYDLGTGYLLYTSTSGYNTVRYKQETADDPETLSLQTLPADQDPTDPNPEPTFDPEYRLYLFFQIPVIGRTSYYLKLMPEYSSEGLFELVKVCNRDGTSTMTPLVDPDYAPPYYVEYERTETTAFASTPNPGNEGVTLVAPDPKGDGKSPDPNANEVEKYLPDLIVGEESRFESLIQVTPATYEQTLTGFDNGFPIYKQGAEITPQKWVKYIKQFKAQGQAIATALEQISIEEGAGELPVATRRANLYTKEQPAPSPSQSTQIPQQQYRYFLQTAGYTAANPIQGTENFPVAQTFQQALIAAKCKLAIENWRNGFTETLQIAGNLQIREGDRFNYLCNGEFRQRVILGVQTTLNILGAINGVPKVTATTSLTLGRWVMPNLTYSKIAVPKEPKAPGYNITVTNVISAELGSMIDWAKVQSRRNPNP